LLWGGVIFALLILLGRANDWIFTSSQQFWRDTWFNTYFCTVTGAAVALAAICTAALRGRVSVTTVRVSLVWLVLAVSVMYGAWFARGLSEATTFPLDGRDLAMRVTQAVIFVAISQLWPIAMFWCLGTRDPGGSTVNGVASLCLAAAVLGIEKTLSVWAVLLFYPWQGSLRPLLEWARRLDGLLYLIQVGLVPSGAVLCWLAARQVRRRRSLVTTALCFMLVMPIVAEARGLLTERYSSPSYPLAYRLSSSATWLGQSYFTLLALTSIVWTTKPGVTRSATPSSADA
jgi:hypothetical protein